MKLRARVRPIETPMPTAPPATETEALALMARMSEAEEASIRTSAALVSLLSWTKALVAVRITFWATAPAPLIAIPTMPKPMAREAAAAIPLMVESEAAVTAISPDSEVTPVSAFRMKASTEVAISFEATATPMEMETPTMPKAAAMEAAPATQEMVDVSRAVNVMLDAEMPARSVPDPPSPSMEASTSMPILFSTMTPEPEAAIPTMPPAMATEKESTSALTVWLAIAVWVSAPAASMLEFFT